MFILKNQATIEKAILRAKAVHPRVSVRKVGEYQVTGSKGNSYTVTCERRNGQKVVDCNCQAGQLGRPCFHAAAAVAQHVYFAGELATRDNYMADLYDPRD